MLESKYSKLLTTLLILGIIMILIIIVIAGVFVIRNGKLDKQASEEVENFKGQVNELIESEKDDSTNTNQISPIIGVENIIADNNSSNNSQKLYKGFPMVGTIEIPAINLQYPVLEESSKTAMEVSVAVYYGPGLNKIGNTTIAGHNYRDGRFFSNNKKLAEGDKIYITDLTGQKINYIIYKIYTTSPEDSSYLDRNTNGKREISLTTCTDDSQSRLIIWAKEQE